jgi:hypothetical protein
MKHMPWQLPRSIGSKNRLPKRLSRISSSKTNEWVVHKSIRLIMMALALLPATARAQPAPAIQWELVNPFRFIRDQKTVDELRTVYAGLSKQTAEALERALQKRADDAVDAERAEARKHFNCDQTKDKAERRRCFAPYLGWFEGLAENNHDKTCWNSDKNEFRKDGPCQDYVYPRSHRVRVWITNPETLGDNAPQWTLQPALTFKPCEQRRFCIEFDVPYQADNPQKVQVFPNPTSPQHVDIQVNDKLIVGLGDSYAAGEGNPDRPAQFAEGRDEQDLLANLLLGHILHITRSPQSDDKTETAWLDRRCHRSMYSYQFKTALQLALANPQEAITYVTYSCAGATTDQIIDAEEKPNEGDGKLRPQLEVLSKLLQNGPNPTRQIDYLLLSTGGNDIGFAKLVAFVVLPKRVIGFLKSSGVSEDQIIENNQKGKFKQVLLTENDCGNYRQLQKALLGGTRCPSQMEMPGIRIKDCEADKPCPRILLTPYPDVFHKEDGQLCDGNRQEFDRPFTRDATRAHRIEVVSKNVFEQISVVQKDSIVTSELGWTLIDGNIKAYAGHGFCALNTRSTSKSAEKFPMPTREHAKWTSFDPWEYRAYETRQRWMRLPVDAKLSTNQVHFLLRFKVDFFLEDDRSNIMHPTAEGLARTADLNVEAIRKIASVAP